MIGVIADDLTGAAELGAVGLKYGLSAEIVVSGFPIGKRELVCCDTVSRSRPAEEAAAKTAEATASLRNVGADWIYKKVDSVLRGNVISEVQACMKQLGRTQALLVPANPLLGRVIRHGKYYVRGKAIHETEQTSNPAYRFAAD